MSCLRFTMADNGRQSSVECPASCELYHDTTSTHGWTGKGSSFSPADDQSQSHFDATTLSCTTLRRPSLANARLRRRQKHQRDIAVSGKPLAVRATTKKSAEILGECVSNNDLGYTWHVCTLGSGGQGIELANSTGQVSIHQDAAPNWEWPWSLEGLYANSDSVQTA